MDKEENRNTESKTDSERKQCQEASVGEKAREQVSCDLQYKLYNSQHTNKAEKINRKLLKKKSRYMNKTNSIQIIWFLLLMQI